jgi:SAM-dependent methyltransferase
MPRFDAPQFDSPLSACPLCLSGRIARYDEDHDGRQVFRCRDCRLLFMNPQYTDRHLADFYATYTNLTHAEDSLFIRVRTLCKHDDFGLIERFVKPGRFLGVGVGDGLELRVAQEHGWQIEGYDVDPQATKLIARRTGATVHSGDFCRLGLSADRYDCIFMDQVLEHPKNPRDYLLEARRLLAPGGVLFIGCPNIRSLSNVGKTVAGKLGLKSKRSRGKHYDMWHHLFYYSPDVLARILENHYGLEVLAAEGQPFAGSHDEMPNRTWLSRTVNDWRRRVPVLESSFRLLARKPAETVGRILERRKAA